MHADLINIILAFFEGFALIISPCILPILPIILSGSLSGNKSRPLGIIIGFICTFILFTLFSRVIVGLAHVSPDTIRHVSFVILIFLGIVMMSTYLTDKFNSLTQRLMNVGNSISTVNKPQSGYWGGMVFGGLIGIIWTPCAGPILAAVIVQVIIQKTTLASILTVMSFAIGAGLPMLLIALAGRRMIDKFSFFRERTILFRKLLGLIIVASVIYLIYSPGSSFSSPSTRTPSAGTSLINGLEHPYIAPAIAGIDAWINSPPLQLNELKGKVVLIDFWTYSCINCIRTLPYLKDWYATYHDKGFEIIGIHSPEFEFEHNLDNVKQAVAKEGIDYPVALDNKFTTWQHFHNEYWPAHYLINKDGYVVYEHFGEGEYDVTENNIRFLLGLTEQASTLHPEGSYASRQTPETYLGYARAENFSSPDALVKNKSALYSYPKELPEDGWALQGKWIIYADKIVADSPGASIKLHFDAGKMFAVLGTERNSITMKLKLNGKAITDKKGSDVINSQVEVTRDQLYSLIDFKEESEATLELIATMPGLEVYSFTFGD
jgi:cytochrome c biogenesis protein CcdA